MRLSSPPTCQLRQGGKNDVVNQQIMEIQMKKPKLLIFRPDDNKKTIYKNLVNYLKQQGIRIKRDSNNEK